MVTEQQDTLAAPGAPVVDPSKPSAETVAAAKAAPIAASPKPSPETEYVVLKQDESGFWSTVNRGSFKSADAALRGVVEKLAAQDQDGTFVAVPARSWRPVTVSTQTTTTVVLGEA